MCPWASGWHLPAADNIERVFLCVLVAPSKSLENCLFCSLAHFLNWVICVFIIQCNHVQLQAPYHTRDLQGSSPVPETV